MFVTYPRVRNLSTCSRAAGVDERADAVGHEAEDAVAHPVDQGAVVQEQEHRRQEAREGGGPAQEAESLSVRDENEKWRRMEKRVCLKPFQKPFKPLAD